MPGIRVFNIALLAPILFLTACLDVGTNHEAVRRDEVSFVRLMENTRFAGVAYARGETFELVELSNGSRVAVMTRNPITSDALVSAIGPLVTTSSIWAVVLDRDYCTVGQGALFSGNLSPREGQRIGVFEGYSLSNPQFVFETGGRFCFEPA